MEGSETFRGGKRFQFHAVDSQLQVLMLDGISIPAATSDNQNFVDYVTLVTRHHLARSANTLMPFGSAEWLLAHANGSARYGGAVAGGAGGASFARPAQHAIWQLTASLMVG